MANVSDDEKDSLQVRKERTLGSGVNPLTTHSSTSGGASIEVAFAASKNGSLIMFTVNVFVAKILSRVFLPMPWKMANETPTMGGSCAS